MTNLVGKFHKLFGFTESLESEQIKFVNRINTTVINFAETYHEYKSIFEILCYWLGENPKDRIRSANRGNFYGDTSMPGLRSLTNDNYNQTLKITSLLFKYFSEDKYGYEEKREVIYEWVETALSNSNLDLGIEWKEGMFYPKGADLLDKKLIEDPLGWLGNFSDTKSDYKKALSCFLKKEYPEVIDHSYLAIEGLVRSVLKNKKTLDNNKKELISKLKLSQQWKSFLDKFTDYANDFKRHASANRNNINPKEVEAFMYLTGLLIRLIISVK